MTRLKELNLRMEDGGARGVRGGERTGKGWVFDHINWPLLDVCMCMCIISIASHHITDFDPFNLVPYPK